jgi:hypothetical protein
MTSPELWGWLIVLHPVNCQKIIPLKKSFVITIHSLALYGLLFAGGSVLANIPGGGTGTGCARPRTSGSFSENARFFGEKIYKDL